MKNEDYEFQLTNEQLQKAIKKYGAKHVQGIYRKLAGLKYNAPTTYEEFEIEKENQAKLKINLGNGGFRYKNLKPGEF